VAHLWESTKFSYGYDHEVFSIVEGIRNTKISVEVGSAPIFLQEVQLGIRWPPALLSKLPPFPRKVVE